MFGEYVKYRIKEQNNVKRLTFTNTKHKIFKNIKIEDTKTKDT